MNPLRGLQLCKCSLHNCRANCAGARDAGQSRVGAASRKHTLTRRCPKRSHTEFTGNELVHSVLVRHVDPWPNRASGDDLLHPWPVPDNADEPFPRQIVLAADVEDAQPVLPERPHLDGLGPELLVAGDDNQIALGRFRNPFGVERTARTLGDQRMSDMDGVLARSGQRQPKASSALVNLEPDQVRHCDHRPAGLRSACPRGVGSSSFQFVPDGGVDEVLRQLVQLGDHLDGVACNVEFANDLGRNAAGGRLAEPTQRVHDHVADGRVWTEAGHFGSLGAAVADLLPVQGIGEFLGLWRPGEHLLVVTDNHEAKATIQADLLFDGADELASLDGQPGSGRGEGIPDVELFAELFDGGPHLHQRHTLVAVLREQSGLDELAPGDRLDASWLCADDRRIGLAPLL